MAELIVTQPSGRTSRHALGARPLVMGRDAGCDLPIDDPSSSRRHARFSATGHGYLVEDLGSKNGTVVNDATCTSHVLRHGDRVLVGATLAVFQESEAASTYAVHVADDPHTSHATKYVSRDKELNLSKQRLGMIYELSERLTTLKGQDQLLDDAMSICFETLHFERGAIGVRRADQRAMDWPVVRNLFGAEGELTISRSLLSRALELGERAVFTEGDTGMADPTVSMVQHGIRSAMCVPLIHHEQVLGVVYGDRVRSSVSYSSEDVDFLAGIAQQISIGLINARLVEEQQRMIRLNHDIDMARKIQTGLFPAKMPNEEGLKIAALNDPGQRVSGDYYDVVELPDGRVWCLIADVSGEGLAAALLMANLQAAVRVTIDESDDPAVLLVRWNSLICRNAGSSKFITCLLILIDPRSRELRCASAGHFPPLIVESGEETPRELTLEPGFPLGVDAQSTYTTAVIQMARKPFLVLCYTDGITEAMNPQGEIFGATRLLEAIAQRGDLPPQSLLKQIRKQVAAFAGPHQSDDITLLAARVG